VLRAYAELGVLILRPSTAVTGYRYYDAKQLQEAVVVALLRRAGVPVADIAEFLANPSG
jgi:DNA-binding transcriptional MerR regulator